jgi:hypothetical protein
MGERRQVRYQPPPLLMKSVRKRSFSEVGSGFTAGRMVRLVMSGRLFRSREGTVILRVESKVSRGDAARARAAV